MQIMQIYVYSTISTTFLFVIDFPASLISKILKEFEWVNGVDQLTNHECLQIKCKSVNTNHFNIQPVSCCSVAYLLLFCMVHLNHLSIYAHVDEWGRICSMLRDQSVHKSHLKSLSFIKMDAGGKSLLACSFHALQTRLLSMCQYLLKHCKPDELVSINQSMSLQWNCQGRFECIL